MNDTRVPDTVAALRELIHASNYIAVFTGAGISTESGIPDFSRPEGSLEHANPYRFFVISLPRKKSGVSRGAGSSPVR